MMQREHHHFFKTSFPKKSVTLLVLFYEKAFCFPRKEIKLNKKDGLHVLFGGAYILSFWVGSVRFVNCFDFLVARLGSSELIKLLPNLNHGYRDFHDFLQHKTVRVCLLFSFQFDTIFSFCSFVQRKINFEKVLISRQKRITLE